MKQGLRKLRGTSFNCEIGEITLCEAFREEDCEFDQLYFQTQLEGVTCKIYDLETDSSQERFLNEKLVHSEHPYEELADQLAIEEIQIRKQNYGVLLFKIPHSGVLRELAPTLTHSEWLFLTETILTLLFKLRAQKQVLLSLTPSSIARTAEGQFRVLDGEYLSAEGSYQQLCGRQQHLLDVCEKEYQYRSPELLDQYGKNKIDHSSDLFSFGTILYELLFRQYPFESKLAQLNCNIRPLPEQSFFTDIISRILQPYPNRASLETIRSLVENERKKVPKQPTTKNMSSGSTTQSRSSNIFSGITQMFSKLTTETQSWYLNFTENDEKAPEEKYLNLLLSKLYKKETKLEKLQSIILKYVTQCDPESRENQLTKTLALILQLFRRGPNVMNCPWDEVLAAMEPKTAKLLVPQQLLAFCRQKLALHGRIRSILRGNFYLQELSKFKNLSLYIMESVQLHLNWTIDSITSKLLFLKKQRQMVEYLREIYCDQILDIISILIFCAVCIRKDNELQLRKDDMGVLNRLQKKLNNALKKISHLSNHVNAHAIYSLEGEFFYYQEEIQLRENPYYTSLEHFYKHQREYKGLCLPQNYALTYSSTDAKQFLSSENNREKSESFRPKSYFQDDESDNEQNNASFKEIDSPSPEKPKQKKKELILEQLKPKKETKNELFNLKQIKPKKQEKKTVTFDQFFKLDNSKASQPTNVKANQSFQFNFGPKDKQVKQGKQLKQVKQDKQVREEKRQGKKSEDFSFFEAFMQPPKEKPKNLHLAKQPSNNFFQNFGAPKESKPKQKNQALGSSNSQKIIQQNILSYDWLKNSSIQPYQAPKPTIDPELLSDILSGLKLKELKEIITNNQQIIIDFKKLKLQKIIGSGSAGEVYFGRYANESLAIKKVKTENPNALKQFERELLTYIKIKRNPYLVSLVGLSKAEGNYYLLTEFCNSGSLFDLLHKQANTTTLSWKQKLSLAQQIAKGMLALHEMKPPIIHRDLKSLNVFVTESGGTYTAKVADFGLSRSPQSEMMTMYLGTLHWMAPELLDNRQYSIKVDIYSYAVVLWEICARKTPYNELSTPMAIIKHVTMEKKRPNLTVIPSDCPPDLIELMKNCWAHEPHDRPSFGQVIERLSKVQIFI